MWSGPRERSVYVISIQSVPKPRETDESCFLNLSVRQRDGAEDSDGAADQRAEGGAFVVEEHGEGDHRQRRCGYDG